MNEEDEDQDQDQDQEQQQKSEIDENETIDGGFDEEEEEVRDPSHADFDPEVEEEKDPEPVDGHKQEKEQEEEKTPVHENEIEKTDHFNQEKHKQCRGDDCTKCPGSNLSILSDQFCDGVVDCPNGADEESCDKSVLKMREVQLAKETFL